MTTQISPEGVLPQSPPSPGISSRRWWGLAVLAVAQFMVVLDATITNIALPNIGRGLHIGTASLSWIITAYVIAFGGLLPFGGRLADLLGRRRMFIAGVSVFTTASLAAGLAQNTAMLISTRAIQGAGAALLAPAALSLVTSMFPARAERDKALSIWGAVAAGGAAAGVLIGGLLAGGPGWRSVFLINVPVGAAVLATVAAVVPASRSEIGGRLGLSRFDVPGAVTVTAGLAMLVATLSEGQSWGWASAATVAGFAAAAALLGLFVAVERRTWSPLVPLRLFAIRTVRAGNIVMLLTGAAMLAGFYFLSLYEQFVLGYGAIAAGVSQLPMAGALVLAAGAAAPLMARFGSRAVLAGALAVFAAGLAWISAAGVHGSFTADLLGPTLLVGLGLGAAFVPVTAVAVANVPGGDAGIAGGLVNTSQQVGGALGLAALAALATARTSSRSAAGVTSLTALTSGYSWAFLAAAAVAAAAAVIAAATLRRHDATEPATV